MQPIIIACVLRSGGEYTRAHVEGLHAQLVRHVQAPFRLVCLTNVPFNHPEIMCEPLVQRWEGWWSKMNLFNVFRKGNVFYMDLDTMVVGDITDIVMPRHGFWGLRDFGAPGSFASGLMAWDGDHSYLYDQFRKDPEGHMVRHARRESWGDQGFIERHLRVPPMAFQDHFGDRIVSWKLGVARGLRTPPSIICFHGKPRPWEAVPQWPNIDLGSLPHA